jgi:hypothetical protein
MLSSSITVSYHVLTGRELLFAGLVGGGIVLVAGIVVAFILWRVLRKQPETR